MRFEDTYTVYIYTKSDDKPLDSRGFALNLQTNPTETLVGQQPSKRLCQVTTNSRRKKALLKGPRYRPKEMTDGNKKSKTSKIYMYIYIYAFTYMYEV